MPRTPLPPDSVRRNYFVRRANDEYLRSLSALSRRTFTEVFNNELRFARTWDLPAHFVKGLNAEADRREVLPKDLVAAFLHGEVSKWPPARYPIQEPPRVFAKRSTLSLTGPNDEYIRQIGERLGIEHTEAVDLVLDFNRRFDLPPQLLGALHERAAALGVSPRAIAVEVLFHEVMNLVMLAGVAAAVVPQRRALARAAY